MEEADNEIAEELFAGVDAKTMESLKKKEEDQFTKALNQISLSNAPDSTAFGVAIAKYVFFSI